MCHLCLDKSGSHTYDMYFKGCQGAQASGKKLQFARRKLMISDYLHYFHAANFLESVSLLFPAQLGFQAFPVTCTETPFGGIFKTF